MKYGWEDDIESLIDPILEDYIATKKKLKNK